MQKFILVTLVLGLAFFLYLLQTEQIDEKDFNISRFKSDAYFEMRKNTDPLSIKSSDVYVVAKDTEYKIFTYSGNDYKKLIKAQYSDPAYKVPLEAKSAVTLTWIGNRYVFYILKKTDKETGKNTYEVYKAEYPTDDASKLKYYLIETIKESDLSNQVEVKY
jgi:hypothetical protein